MHYIFCCAFAYILIHCFTHTHTLPKLKADLPFAELIRREQQLVSAAHTPHFSDHTQSPPISLLLQCFLCECIPLVCCMPIYSIDAHVLPLQSDVCQHIYQHELCAGNLVFTQICHKPCHCAMSVGVHLYLCRVYIRTLNNLKCGGY